MVPAVVASVVSAVVAVVMAIVIMVTVAEKEDSPPPDVGPIVVPEAIKGVPPREIAPQVDPPSGPR